MFPAVSGMHADELMTSLEQALVNLRQTWPAPWPGLTWVFEQCWARLGYAPQGLGERTQALLAFAQRAARHIETGQTPPVHAVGRHGVP